MDPDAEFDALRGGGFGIAPDHRLLHLGCTAQRVDDAGELDEQPVARRLDQPAPMRGDCRVDQFRTDRRLAAILAADVVGYSRLIGADEEGTLDRLRSRSARFRPAVSIAAQHSREREPYVAIR